MPIVVSHQPRAATIAGAAFDGAALQAAAKANLAQQEMDRRDAAQARNIQAGLLERQMANQQQAQMMGLNQQFDMQRMAFQDQLMGQRQAQDDQRQEQAWQRNADWMWGVNAAEDMERTAGGAMAEFSKKADSFTPDGKRLYGDLSGKYRAIQKAKPTLRPDAYNAAMGKFMEELEASNLGSHIKEPPTPEEVFKSSVYIDPEGMRYIIQPDGTIRPIAAPKTNKPEKPPATFEERYQDFDQFTKDFDAVRKQLMDEQKTTGADGELLEPTPPSAQQVRKAMKERFNEWQKAVKGVVDQESDTVAQTDPRAEAEAQLRAQLAPLQQVLGEQGFEGLIRAAVQGQQPQQQAPATIPSENPLVPPAPVPTVPAGREGAVMLEQMMQEASPDAKYLYFVDSRDGKMKRLPIQRQARQGQSGRPRKKEGELVSWAGQMLDMDGFVWVKSTDGDYEPLVKNGEHIRSTGGFVRSP